MHQWVSLQAPEWLCLLQQSPPRGRAAIGGSSAAIEVSWAQGSGMQVQCKYCCYLLVAHKLRCLCDPGVMWCEIIQGSWKKIHARLGLLNCPKLWRIEMQATHVHLLGTVNQLTPTLRDKVVSSFPFIQAKGGWVQARVVVVDEVSICLNWTKNKKNTRSMKYWSTCHSHKFPALT